MEIEHKTPAQPATLRELAARHKRAGAGVITEGGVTYEPVTVQSLLTRNPNPGLRHYWSINPYRGCQFGCTYCYARYTAKFVELHDPRAFERRIFYKVNAPELARRLRDRDFYGRPVLLGAATDPWQPAEARLAITRGILAGLARYPSLDLFGITKSALVRRDADLLARLAAEGRRVGVGVSLTTLDEALARSMEPQAALPRERLNTMRALSDAGVDVTLMLMPVMPGLTDSDASLGAVLTAARAHGARYALANVLHLRTEPKRAFMPWLAANHPHLAGAYTQVYGHAARHGESYREAIRERVQAWRERLGFAPETSAGQGPPKGAQLDLFPGKNGR
jgi:DNA repair photolyase